MLSGQGVSPAASLQIQALEDEKESRTPEQQKIDSQLLYALKMERVPPTALQSLQVDVGQSEQGRVVVDISGTIDDKLLQVLTNMGATVVVSTPEYNSIRVEVGLDRLEEIALSDSVRFIQPKQDCMLAGVSSPTTTVDDVRSSTGFHAREQRVRTQLAKELNATQSKDASLQPGFMTTFGSFHSEGDVTHRANTARGTFNTDGTGVKIGVLSNGVISIAQSQALGELGLVTILPGQVGSGDEGTAMLEVIHDLAPGAQLYFATGAVSIGSFARNIRNLRAAGCDIIVDDVGYFAETPFQDGQAPAIISNTNGGVVLQAVNDVTSAGALYFSSAGNGGNKDIATSTIFQGDFVDGGANALTPGGTVNNFGGGTLFDTITSSSGAAINLYWADPLGASANDYDLFVLNSTGTAVIAASTNVQNGTQDPFEQVASSANATNNRIVVLKKTAAAPRFFYLTVNGNISGRLAIT
ncbi:MAG TPA: hypothetical protein VFF42_08690, partial [Candidatus Eremiobacteraceae bacterium]|nr:hypothetical protein [Candidatus Eremiobacteraceae bacterium]